MKISGALRFVLVGVYDAGAVDAMRQPMGTLPPLALLLPVCRLSMYRLAREAWVHFLFELGKQAAADSQQQAAADRSEF